MKWLVRISIGLGVISCLLVALAGPAYQAGLVSLELALLRGFRIATLCGLAAAAVGLVAAIGHLLAKRPGWGGGLLAVILGLAGAAVPLGMRMQVQEVPMIHDITTDVADPPAFEAVLAARAGAPNPPDYDPAVAPLQQEAYPDLKPIRVVQSPAAVMDAAAIIVTDLGWESVAIDTGAGRIEATDTTRWFGFKDDVVIRVRSVGGATVVDVRSKSRVGRSDLGKNADRIRAFRHALLESLTAA
ncbi:MAG: DUF1499 domain-containing protein [Pseudomonadota bacterium]